MLQKLKNKQGFTLIEIVIVLAIAALIMVIVFFAVAGAQRTRKDQQRKDLVARVVSQLENYASNNAGCFPTTSAFNGNGTTSGGCPANTPFWGAYMQNTAADPNGQVTYTAPISSTVITVTDESNYTPHAGDGCGTATTDPGKLAYGVGGNGRIKRAMICLGTGQWYNPEQ
jgi:prepilin-type N-terminal cleavage/methylation domain-containing protein